MLSAAQITHLCSSGTGKRSSFSRCFSRPSAPSTFHCMVGILKPIAEFRIDLSFCLGSRKGPATILCQAANLSLCFIRYHSDQEEDRSGPINNSISAWRTESDIALCQSIYLDPYTSEDPEIVLSVVCWFCDN